MAAAEHRSADSPCARGGAGLARPAAAGAVPPLIQGPPAPGLALPAVGRWRLRVARWWSMPRVVLAVAGVVCAAVLYELPPEDYAIYPRCLMFSLTGWQCPGCGGLRAAHALLHGRVAAAWALNPMAVVLGVLGGVYAACHVLRRVTGRDWVGFWRRPIWPWVWLGVLVLFTLLRNWPAAAAWLAP